MERTCPDRFVCFNSFWPRHLYTLTFLPLPTTRATQIVTPCFSVGILFLIVKLFNGLKTSILCIIFLKSRDFLFSLFPINCSRARASAVFTDFHMYSTYTIDDYTINYSFYLHNWYNMNMYLIRLLSEKKSFSNMIFYFLVTSRYLRTLSFKHGIQIYPTYL